MPTTEAAHIRGYGETAVVKHAEPANRRTPDIKLRTDSFSPSRRSGIFRTRQQTIWEFPHPNLSLLSRPPCSSSRRPSAFSFNQLLHPVSFPPPAAVRRRSTLGRRSPTRSTNIHMHTAVTAQTQPKHAKRCLVEATPGRQWSVHTWVCGCVIMQPLYRAHVCTEPRPRSTTAKTCGRRRVSTHGQLGAPALACARGQMGAAKAAF